MSLKVGAHPWASKTGSARLTVLVAFQLPAEVEGVALAKLITRPHHKVPVSGSG